MSAARQSNPLSALLVGPPSPSLKKLEERLSAMSGWEVALARAAGPAEALAALREDLRDIVFVEHPLPGADALLLMAQVRQLHPKTSVVIVTPGLDEAAAVACMKSGALDYLRAADLNVIDLEALARRVHEVRYLV